MPLKCGWAIRIYLLRGYKILSIFNECLFFTVDITTHASAIFAAVHVFSKVCFQLSFFLFLSLPFLLPTHVFLYFLFLLYFLYYYFFSPRFFLLSPELKE